MKLLTRLRDTTFYQSTPSQAVLAWLDGLNSSELEESTSQSELVQFGNPEDDEHIGVGAAMPQDVAGLNFLDSCRRRIPDIHEDFPPHGVSFDDYGMELAS
jgi:hypothetical protein